MEHTPEPGPRHILDGMSNVTLEIPHLRGCAWFDPQPPDPRLAAGEYGALAIHAGPPDVAFVEPMLRRRLSRLARGFFHCAQAVSPPGEVRVVFASRHGEADRTLAILKDLAGSREVSPALFSMSVHNAVAGLWSILKANRAPATALAAGPDSFGWGLVEAAGALQADPGVPVLFVYADEPLPEPWAAPGSQPGSQALALLLGGGEGPRLRFHMRADSPGPAGPAQAQEFLAAWRDGGGDWGRWRGSFE